MKKSSLVRNEKGLSPSRGRFISERMVELEGGDGREPENATGVSKSTSAGSQSKAHLEESAVENVSKMRLGTLLWTRLLGQESKLIH